MSIGLVLSDDLLFASKITSTASALGLNVRVARTPEALLHWAAQETPRGVLLDLHHPQLDLPTFLAALGKVPVVAYGSHVQAACLHAARQAGCSLVLPRSKFVERLPHDLPCWLGQTSPSVASVDSCLPSAE
ncbi:MAG: response regulator [Gemmataceae bacterium]